MSSDKFETTASAPESNNNIEYGGESYDEETFAKAARKVVGENFASNPEIRTQSEILPYIGKQYNGERDIYDVLGYTKNPQIEDYRARYERGDIAERIVRLPAEDTWRHEPEISDKDEEEETAFQESVKQFVEQTSPYQYIRRTDVLSGIGQFGVLLIGAKEEGEETSLADPLEPGSLSGPEDIAFYQPFAQDSIETWDLGKEVDREPTDEMYNSPVNYNIDFSTLDEAESDLHDVHHTRLIHFPAGPRDESELKADPRLQTILNRLEDLDKVVGASAEMFWSGADRKFQFDISSDNATDISDAQLSKMDNEVQKLVHEMQQHVKTFNTDIEVIGGETPDPTGVVDSILKFIAGATGIPTRKLTGSERGELASSQDQANWYGQIENRQNTFAEPVILRPFIDRMIDLGVIEEPNGGTYEIEWPNLFELTELEETNIEESRSMVVKNISPGGDPSMLPTDYEEIFDYVENGDTIEFDEEMPEPEPLPEGEQLREMMDEGDMTDDSEQPDESDDEQSEDIQGNSWLPRT